jgi:penicillin-binding protein 2
VKRIAFLLLSLTLAGCTLTGGPSATEAPAGLPTPVVTSVAAPDPEATARQFLDAWAKWDYPSMYAMLSPLTQDAVSLEDFTERYTGVRTGAAAENVACEIVSSLVNPREAQVRYRVRLMSSVVGEVSRETWMDLKRIDGDWKIAWTETAILPELEGGKTLYLSFLQPQRANIYDRNGLALATQTDTVGLYIVPSQMGDEDAEKGTLRVLGRLLDMRSENIQGMYESFRDTDFLIPVGEVSYEEFQPYEDALTGSGVNWSIYPGRYYYGGGVAPHAVGYVAQIREEELEDYLARGYQRDEFVGQTGLELIYQDELRGKPGGTLYLVNPDGNIGQAVQSRDPEPPQAIYTTLDRDLQRNVRDALTGFGGAVVVLERDTGRVLAIASAPAFDPNLFDGRNPNSSPGLTEVLSDTRQPLYDRATVGGFPLGSVFKIITMSAALESGLYTPDSLYTCDGEFKELPGETFYDWTVAKDYPPHGEVTLVQGLERSCNPYFWHIGLDLFNQGKPTAVSDMAAGFGLGSATGIEIGDTAGQLPSPDWKLQTTGEGWAAGDAVQLAIGQASLNVSPLQVVRFVAALGNGGTLYRPTLVDKIQSAEGAIRYQSAIEQQGKLPVSQETMATLRQAMTQVVRADRGTARRTFLGLNLNVAGKTGTAESGDVDPHAWFAGYTFEEREDKPDIAVVVLVEYQGEGSDWAAPIFRRVVESYFLGGPRALYRWESQIGVTRTPTDTPGPGEETPQP